jgi:hypothetical protein
VIGSGIRDPDQPGLAAGAPAVAAVGEEQLVLAARAQPARLDSRDSGAVEQSPGDLGQIEHPPGGDPVAERPELRPDLVADFVAARADPWPDGGRFGAYGLDPGADYPAGEAAPAAMEHRHPVASGDRHGQAIGDLDERCQRR